ncbi:Arylsulfatase A [Bryocella elongata]|uniref:Arylsulfatase A n=1 Tax=Bryocella elongata TaxID=863522 RepID=A0A1H6C2G8_9BACT|nr:sulfatase-like hydrolase/transferase [Bryocella elongata]SEG67073.1 Arylsulfatase A [Bryocella elongata]
MDRRRFLELAAGATISGSAASAAAPAYAAAQTRGQEAFVDQRRGTAPFERTRQGRAPNIFLICADMVGPDLYHPERSFSRHVQLPAIRALMDDGTFFANAFCTVPLCSPSRASYLTGRYSYIQGNGERAPEGLETQLRRDDTIFPEYLKASGYETRQVGKAHVGSDKFLDAFGENDNPWDRWSPPVFDDDGYLAYQRSLGVKPQKYSREIVFKQQDRVSPGNSAGGWIVQEDGKAFPFEAHYSYYLAKRAVDTLRNYMENGTAARHPVYLQLDIFDPHQPFSIPSGFEEREKELRAAVKLPASYERAVQNNFKREANEPEILNVYRRYWGIYDAKALVDYRVAYALQMELVDRVIGYFLSEVTKLGLYDESVVAFISDHGEMNGRRAMVDKGVYLYPDVLRVPMIFKVPGAAKGRVVQDTVSLLDLSQTLLDVAGVRPEAMMDGVSLLPVIGGGNVERANRLLFFGGWHVGVNFACGLERRTSDGRHYVYAYNCSSPCDELYDLDSEDAVNLIDEPQYAGVCKEMIQALGAELQKDPRWVGYWAEFRIARYDDLPKMNGDMQLFTKPS